MVTDTKSSRCLFQLVPLEPRTEGTECSSLQDVLLQTPTTVQTDEEPDKMRARAEKNGYKNGTKFGSLTSQIKYDERVKRMFSMPTPTATMREDFERVERLKEKGATTIYSRANNPDGTGRHHGLLTYMGFYNLMPQPFLKTPCTADSYTDKMKSKGVSGTSGTLAQDIVNGFAEKHRGLLLPTPLAVEREHPDRVAALKAAGADCINSRANGKQRPNGLIDFMQFYDMLPTPRANIVNGCDLSNPKLAERNKSNLEEEVAKMVTGLLPTPVTRDHKGISIKESKHRRGLMEEEGSTLPDVVDRILKGVESGMLPTPVTQDFKKREPNSKQQDLGDMLYGMANGSKSYEQVKKSAAHDGQTFRLSPLFTQEMMGFPFGWTELPFLSENGEQKP